MGNVLYLDDATLRRRAEARLSGIDLPSKLPLSEPIKMLHELQVLRVALDVQNEDLQASKRRADQVTEKYATLLELAPVAILTLRDNGHVLEANLRAASMFGDQGPASLVGRSLLAFLGSANLDAVSALLSAAIEQGAWAAEELELQGRNHRLPLIVNARAQSFVQEGEVVLLVAMEDVTRATQMRDDVSAYITRNQQLSDSTTATGDEAS